MFSLQVTVGSCKCLKHFRCLHLVKWEEELTVCYKRLICIFGQVLYLYEYIMLRVTPVFEL